MHEPAAPLSVDSGAPHKSRLAWLALASFTVTMWLPLCGASRFGDLSDWYSDHLHHAYSVWVFAARGFDVYRLRFSEAAQGVAYPQAFLSWGHNPVVYPPGIFAVFGPPALLGKLWPMTQRQFGVLNVIWLLGLAHLSIYAFWSSLAAAPRGARALVGLVLWMMLLRMALNGFYDVVWLGCAAMMAKAAAARRYGNAFVWCSAAAFTHYRAAVLLPLLLWLALELLKEQPRREWPWRRIALACSLGGIALYSFVVMYPHTTAALGTRGLGSLLATSLRAWLVLGAGLAAVGATRAVCGWVPAATALLIAAISLLELPTYRHSFWHSCIGLILPLLADVPAATRGRGASSLRQIGLALLFAIDALVFADDEGGAFGLLAQLARFYQVR